MRKFLLFRWNYPLRWHVRRIGLTKPYRDGTPNEIEMVREVMKLTGVGLNQAYEFIKRMR